ncbi:MAG TPA: CbtB domain-containing protein [Dongiaceae bacterium]|jgi:cobalt transporter subunit CbtB
METNNETKPLNRSAVGSRTGVAVPVACAALLGLFLISMVGFAGPDVIHNAAHDTRHGAAFPCH